MLKDLTFETLGLLDDGAAGVIANAELRIALNDLEERGHEDGKVRKVVFELEMQKIANNKVAARLSAQAKIPARRTNDTSAGFREKAGELTLQFRDNNPENEEQPTFDDVKGSR